MQARDVMSQGITSIGPTDSIVHAAELMGERDIGVLPVVDRGKLVGIVTDRDLVVRGIAGGLHGDAPVLNVMSREVLTCRPEDDLDTVLETMSEQQVRRLPVSNSKGDLLGMISIADLARNDPEKQEVADTLRAISRPAGEHSPHVVRLLPQVPQPQS